MVRGDRDSIKEKSRESLKRDGVLPLLYSGRDNEIEPNYSDLAYLYQLIRLRRPRVVVEFGVGFSTIVIAQALLENQGSKMGGIGHLYSVDSEQVWIDNTREKLSDNLSQYVTFSCSPVIVDIADNTLCHRYETLPNISPNFIYLDGPWHGTPNSKGEIYGLNNNIISGSPVVGADVLLYESLAPLDFFILVDGRWKNCRFLHQRLKGKYKRRISYKRKNQTFEYLGE